MRGVFAAWSADPLLLLLMLRLCDEKSFVTVYSEFYIFSGIPLNCMSDLSGVIGNKNSGFMNRCSDKSEGMDVILSNNS